MSFSEGQKVGRVTILRKVKEENKFVVQCECGSPEFTLWRYSLSHGKRLCCGACQQLERDYKNQIADACRKAEKLGLIFHPPSDRPHWEWAGDEDALAREFGGEKS